MELSRWFVATGVAPTDTLLKQIAVLATVRVDDDAIIGNRRNPLQPESRGET